MFSPEDYKQSDAVRIMYVHVPAAWISISIFFLISILSFGVLIFKNKNFILISKSLAPSGFVFNIIALVTGSLWGKPTWGHMVGLGCKNFIYVTSCDILFDVHNKLENF